MLKMSLRLSQRVFILAPFRSVFQRALPEPPANQVAPVMALDTLVRPVDRRGSETLRVCGLKDARLRLRGASSLRIRST